MYKTVVISPLQPIGVVVHNVTMPPLRNAWLLKDSTLSSFSVFDNCVEMLKELFLCFLVLCTELW